MSLIGLAMIIAGVILSLVIFRSERNGDDEDIWSGKSNAEGKTDDNRINPS
jgi:hypothetical protein